MNEQSAFALAADLLDGNRGPRTDDELHAFVLDTWGVTIPRTQVCPDHVAPFTAFAESYFARASVTVWHGSRGFGGKTFMLGVLGLTEALTLGAGVTVLGGSSLQSERIVAYKDTLLMHPGAPRDQITSRDAKTSIRFAGGGSMQALTASSKSVRGGHDPRFRGDEVDEMDLRLFDAAMGQTMSRPGIPKQTTLSSTWQYPDGTFAEVLRRAKENGWPVRTWCFLESSNPVDGWLDPLEVQSKRGEVTEAMWRSEYELQEPGFDDPAFQADRLQACVTQAEPETGTLNGGPGELVTFPTDQVRFVTAADWARKKDWTVNVALTLTDPAVLVAYRRNQRAPWPLMVQAFDDLRTRYPGHAIHDETGIGDVVGDYLAGKAEGVIMAGRDRQALFQDYILAIEHGKVRLPNIAPLIAAHRWCRTSDLFGAGHPPDEVVACALAWRIVKKYVNRTPGRVSFAQGNVPSIGPRR